MKTPVKRLLARLRLHRPASRAYRHLQTGSRIVCRIARRTDSRIAKRYLAEAEQPKLHLGCGGNLLDGWLNSDLAPRSAHIMRLDAGRRFPFADGTFAYVYGEHMIGSLPFHRVPAMLGECLRVLAPGGKVRITTLDLAFVTGLHGRERSATQDRYAAWRAPFYFDYLIRKDLASPRERRMGYAEWAAAHVPPAGTAGFVINNLMRAGDIAFAYDEPLLRGLLENAGFSGIVKRDRHRSDDAALRDLAHNRPRMPEGFLQLESLTLEGSKPRGAAARSVPDPMDEAPGRRP